MGKFRILSIATLLIATFASSGAVSSSGGGTGERYSDQAVVQSDVKIAQRDLRRINEALIARGYYDIEVVANTPPYFEVEACQDNRLFVLRVNRYGEIKDRDDVARCTGSDTADAPATREYDDPDNVVVDTPGAKVVTGDRGTHVKTPFGDVKVDKDGGVHIRAPFVDLKIPKN